MDKKFSTKVLVEGGIMLGLAMALSYVKIYNLPNGGSVTAGSMVPILLFAYRHGMAKGLVVGAAFGLLQFIFGPMYSFHPISILCDYVLAFAMLGLGGVFGKGLYQGLAGVTLAVALRFVNHVISGVVVFASYAPAGQNPVVYSSIYNASYMIPELIISLMLFGLLYKPLEKTPL